MTCDERRRLAGHRGSTSTLPLLVDTVMSTLYIGLSRLRNWSRDVLRFHDRSAIFTNAVAGVQLPDNFAEARVCEWVGEKDQTAQKCKDRWAETNNSPDRR